MARTTISPNIKNPEVAKVADRLAEFALQRPESCERQSIEIKQMQVFANRTDSLPLLDDRTDDEILGYNAAGNLI